MRVRAALPADDAAAADAAAALILRDTAALDVRCAEEQRRCLPLKRVRVDTRWGPVGVHLSLRGSEVFKVRPRVRAGGCVLLLRTEQL